ncbi:hypothetical protein H7200_00350 [Candidatus Saccharibacteria bacterium]|nr:hypothetical protein [Candidatus Saccharibacteria bacterium]
MSAEFSHSEREGGPVQYEFLPTDMLRTIVENTSQPDTLSRIIKVALERHFDDPHDTDTNELVWCAVEKQAQLLKDDLSLATLDAMTRVPSTDEDYEAAAARIALFKSPQE